MDSKVSSEENDAPNYVKLKKRATTVSPRRIRNEWVIKIKSLMEKADLLGRDAPIDIDFSTWKELEKVLRRRVMETVQSYDLFRSETLDIAKSNLCDNTERLVTITLDKGSVELKAHIAEELFVPSLRATVSLDDVGLSVEAPLAAFAVVSLCRQKEYWSFQLLERMGAEVVHISSLNRKNKATLQANVAQVHLCLEFTGPAGPDIISRLYDFVKMAPLNFVQPWKFNGELRTFNDSSLESYLQICSVLNCDCDINRLHAAFSLAKMLHDAIQLLAPHTLIGGSMQISSSKVPSDPSGWITVISSSVGIQVATTLHTLFESGKSKKEIALEKELTEVKKLLETQRQQIANENATWQAERAMMTMVQQGVKDIVKLDVGGTKFTTTRVTLTKQPNSFFSAYFNDEVNASLEGDGFFIDRSPEHFNMILNWLRDGEVVLPATKQHSMELLQEAKYYLLKGLEERILEHIRNII